MSSQVVNRYMTAPQIAHRTKLSATAIHRYVRRYPETMRPYFKGIGRGLLIRETGIPVMLEILAMTLAERKQLR